MKILLAEDDRISQRVARRALEGAGHEVEVVEDGEQAWQSLLADPDRLLVTDWMMPNMDGIELIRRVRAGTFSSYVYAIIVTALDDSANAVRGLGVGADDYLGKPYDGRELVARVGVGARIVGLEHELRESRRQLGELTTLDPVTGLLNRRAAMARAFEEAARAADGGHAMSLALLAVDGLDEMASEHGRARADEVLRAAGSAIRAELRPYFALGQSSEQVAEFLPGVRWGGDELLLVLPGMVPSQAHAEIARVRSALVRLRLPLEWAAGRALALSAGVAGVVPGERADVDALLERARAELNAAHGGRAAA